MEGLEDHHRTAQAMVEGKEFVQSLVRVSEEILKAYKRGNKTIFFGNGGSAADAQHMSAEFSGKYLLDRRSLPALSLTTNPSCVTALGNDWGYESVFERQLEAHARPGDVVVGISTSGNSANVVKAIRKAKELGAVAIAWVGAKECLLDKEADVVLKVPSSKTSTIQECHLLAGHVICERVERKLFQHVDDLHELEKPENAGERAMEQLKEHFALVDSMKNGPVRKAIEEAAREVSRAYKDNGKVIVFGNGGSAAQAQQIAAELSFLTKRNKALPAITFNDNTSSVTAIGNDYGYDTVFERQTEGSANQGDVVIGLSTSGNSPNVVKAIQKAKQMGVKTIALVGLKECKLDREADIVLKMPTNSTPRVQEGHIISAYAIKELVEKAMF